MALRRRSFLCGCAGFALAGCGGGEDGSPAVTAQSAQVRGCGYSSSVYGSAYPGCGVPVSSSGNPAVDAAFSQEYLLQRQFWGLGNVSFSFLNDCNSPNAYADRNGNILFGLSMASQMYSRFGSTIPLWQILAHEFGHQIQFALGSDWLRAPTVAPTELEADMFSGYYLITAKSFVSPLEMQTSVQTAFSIGNFAFNDPGFHGTPNQRAASVVAGGAAAVAIAQGRLARTYPALRSYFAQELVRITNTVF